jgi:hypothetical protein
MPDAAATDGLMTAPKRPSFCKVLTLTSAAQEHQEKSATA